jgi:hypothetical protein
MRFGQGYGGQKIQGPLFRRTGWNKKLVVEIFMMGNGFVW